MVFSVMLACSEVTGESTLGFGETRGLGNANRGEKSWVVLLPNSVLDGCGIVSNIDMWYTMLGTRQLVKGRCGSNARLQEQSDRW